MIARRLEKQKDKLKAELGELGGWRRCRSAPKECPDRRHALSLLSVEPLPGLAPGEEAATADAVQYRATLRLAADEFEHAWQTEPFTFDDLVAAVVRARVSHATKWCHLDRARKEVGHLGPSGRWDQKWLRDALTCALRAVAPWAFGLLITLALAGLVLPLVRSCLGLWAGTGEEESPVADWAVAMAIALGTNTSALALAAGMAEMSFLPTKAILQLERKDETEQVQEQLRLLMNCGDCLSNLDVCNFLNFGMATYHNSSETQKEGSCFCRRHESAEAYFRGSHYQRLSLFCCTMDCRCRRRRGCGSSGRRAGLQERWLVLRKDGLALFSSVMDKDPTDMLFFDTSFSLFRDDEDRVLVCGASWVLELEFGGRQAARRRSCQSWCSAVTLAAQLSPRTKEQRFGSFAPVRQPAESKKGDRHTLRLSKARYLVGGAASFRKIAQAILLAEHEIFVLGWFVTPHLPLVREGEPLPGGADPRLSRLLRGAANRGVRVFVLLYHETGAVVPNDSEWAEAELLHPNVFVVRHRSRFDINRLWSHHEKVVVVDQQLAFLGGIDLCLGRYDDARYRLRDAGGQIWDGQDYSNPRIKDFVDVRSAGARDILDRRHQPRMPWQDVHCALLGRPARDVARHCIERWNHAKSMRPHYAGLPTALLHRKVAVCNDRLVDLVSEAGDGCWPEASGPWHECTAQVVRSVGRWSAGTRAESSAHAAYCDLIQGAERFVYIENQFFCSGLDGDDMIGNRVAEAIYRRIVKAHERNDRFHVMIVLPLLPALEGPIADSTPSHCQYVMHWQYRTFRVLRQSLRDAGVDVPSVLAVYGLRTHEKLSDGGPPVTEEVYVHSKVMVVDDRVAVVGSANVNDRSLLGTRDSEVCVVLRDAGHSAQRPAGFAAGLRKALFARHLGWSAEDLDSKFSDPASEESLGEVRRVARQNTEIYEELFEALPSDRVRSWAELSARRSRVQEETGHAPPDSPRAPIRDYTRVPSLPEAERLSQVQGHIVEYPIDFLAEEDLSPGALSVGGLAPDCFT